MNPLKTRYFLLSRLIGQLESVLNEYNYEKGISERSMETNTT